MNRPTLAALAAGYPPSLRLSLDVPRDAWAGLIEHAASALEGRCIFDSESLAQELRAIANTLRAEVSP